MNLCEFSKLIEFEFVVSKCSPLSPGGVGLGHRWEGHNYHLLLQCTWRCTRSVLMTFLLNEDEFAI